MVERKRKAENLLNSLPEPDPELKRLINASDADIDKEFKEQREYEVRILKEEGLEKGKQRILEEGMDLLVDRLNAYQKYFEQIEAWKETVKSEPIIVKKRKVQAG